MRTRPPASAVQLRSWHDETCARPSGASVQKTAVQRRYNLKLFLGVLTFTAVTRVQIPSGTPNLFSDLEGTVTVFLRHKKEQQNHEIGASCRSTTAFPKICRLFRRHKKAQ